MKTHFNKLLVTILILLLEGALIAQKEANIWYFGNKAGLDFSTSPPTVLTDGVMNTPEGCASIADSNGNLLFYTNGETIWDKTQNVMANGSGLLGHESTTQSALILPKPNSSHLYYVFCLDAQGGTNGLTYNVVDMSLASGNGSVITKNVPLHNSCEEKLAATLHANGTDIWVLTHDYNSDVFRAFLVTSSIINTNPVISSTGLTHTLTDIGITLGQIKFSPLGNKLALACRGLNQFELYDFDNTTGQVYNGFVLADSVAGAYGCEFSASGANLYGSGNGGGQSPASIRQWNICSSSTQKIIESQQVINTTSVIIGSLQLGIDKRIYVARYFQPTIGVIEFPENQGIACSYLENSIGISPAIGKSGLPNFPTWPFAISNSFSLDLATQTTLCAGENKVVNALGASGYSWNGVAGGPSYTLEPAVTSVYTVTGTFNEGCPLNKTFTIEVDPCTALEDNGGYLGPAEKVIFVGRMR